MQFPSFIHSQKRNPQTHMKDPDMVWDFWSLRPESLHQVAAAEPKAVFGRQTLVKRAEDYFQKEFNLVDGTWHDYF